MNCKEGDLARIIDHEFTREYKIVDKIVELTFPGITPDGYPGWHFKEFIDLPDRILYGLADYLLRPIRNQPGEDETLSWAPVPTKIIEFNNFVLEIK